MAGWTEKKVQGQNSGDALVNGRVLQGRRKEMDVGTGKRKRLTVTEITKTSQEERKAKRARKENVFRPAVSNEAEGRALRSGKKF
jgi:NAD(P)H-hydrate repair Nnr-like enzyme with NAD(P)H-hydrate epimerase domain